MTAVINLLNECQEFENIGKLHCPPDTALPLHNHYQQDSYLTADNVDWLARRTTSYAVVMACHYRGSDSLRLLPDKQETLRMPVHRQLSNPVEPSKRHPAH